MEKLLTILFFIFLFSCTNNSSLESTENIFNGDVNLITQAEVESFGSNNYTEITGELNIGGANFGTDITNLEYLSSLNTVGGLYISLEGLINFNGLHNLSAINGDFYIRSINIDMENFNGLESLSEINGDFRIVRSYFKNFIGLENLSINNGSLEIFSGYELTSLSGLQLTTIGGDLRIINCDLLTDLTGIETLTSLNGNLIVQNNENLTSLYGLQNLLETNNVIIGGETEYGSSSPNESLADFCDLTNLFTSGEFGSVTITNNLYNPTSEDIINNNCSL